MTIFSKLLTTSFLIVFVFFFAWPISDEVSWSITKIFWTDRSRVDAGAAAVGATLGALLYGLLIACCVLIMKKLWFSNKKNVNQDKNINSPDLSDYAYRSKEQTGLVPWSLKEPDNSSVVGSCPHCAGNPSTKRCNFCFKEPSMKICPFCAEKVKYAAIKCKHCYSDISGSESN